MKSKRLVGLLLVKSQSNRLPEKNIRPYNGQPMFVTNLHKCLKVFDEVYVSSDSYAILAKATLEGGLPIHREENLCGDCPDIPVFQHALSKMDAKVDGIVAVHVDTPLIESNLIALTKRLMEMGVQEVMTCKPMAEMEYGFYKEQANRIGGSIRGISRERLENYDDPYHPNPEVLLVDDSPEIETLEDYNNLICQ